MLEPDNAVAGAVMAQALIDAGRARFGEPLGLLAISGAKKTYAAVERDKGVTIEISSGLQGNERVAKLGSAAFVEGMAVEVTPPPGESQSAR